MQAIALILLKISKHLALLVCLLILTRSSGASIAAVWILLLALTAAGTHVLSRACSFRALRTGRTAGIAR
jgi:hypothetical protein